jgi:hypothetical protein
VTLRLVVAKRDVDAARAAGTLLPPELLLLSTGGARVLVFEDVPEEVNEEWLDRADALQELLERLRGMEYDLGMLGRPFPDPAPWVDAVWVQAALPVLAAKHQVVLAGRDGTTWPAQVRREKDRTVVSALVPADVVPDLALLRQDDGLSGADLKEAVLSAFVANEGSETARAELSAYLAGHAPADGSTTVVLEVDGKPVDAATVDLDAVQKIMGEGPHGQKGALVRLASTPLQEVSTHVLAATSATVAAVGPSLLAVDLDGRQTTVDLTSSLPAVARKGATEEKGADHIAVAGRLAVVDESDGAPRLRLLAAAGRHETTW